MKPSILLGYTVLAVAILAPAGLRVVTWKKRGQHDLDTVTVQTGEMLFKHNWTPKDPLAHGGDGLGPVYNATSCVACHNKGGVGGAGGLDNNVTTFTVKSDNPTQKSREGVVHAYALKTGQDYTETLSQVHPSLPPTSRPSLNQLVVINGQPGHCLPFPTGVHVSQRNTPALFGTKLIDEIPDRVIVANEKSERLRWGMASPQSEQLPVGRASRLRDGRIGHFGWKGQSATLSDFVQAACANELGLGNPGQAQPIPLGKPDYRAPGFDLTLEQCNQLTSYIASLPKPIDRSADDIHASAGKNVFHALGCTECHQPNVGHVQGIYSDLLLHRMGRDLVGGGSYNDPIRPMPDDVSPSDDPKPDEWRTPPLWGVADSAPYLHDGRAPTLEEAILMHAGQGEKSAKAFRQADPVQQKQILAFLRSLRAPSP